MDLIVHVGDVHLELVELSCDVLVVSLLVVNLLLVLFGHSLEERIELLELLLLYQGLVIC